MSQTTETIEMRQSTPPVDTGSDEDQCWRDVKAETGFSSYREFLEALPRTGPRFDRLLYVRSYRPYWSDTGEVFVLDILQDGSTSISLQIQNGDDSPARRFSTQLLQNLRSPPENVPARIVFWSVSRRFNSLNPDMMDALGLGLDVHPSFFESVLRLGPSKRTGWRPNRLYPIKIGDYIATVARNYRPVGRAPPVLLVAGASHLNYRIWKEPPSSFLYRSDDRRKTYEEAYSKAVVKVLNEDLGDKVSPYHCDVNRFPQGSLVSPVRYYLRVIGSYTQKSCRLDSGDDALLWMAILPLLNLEVLRLRVQRELFNSIFLQVQYSVELSQFSKEDSKQKDYDTLDEQRFWLRRRLEDLEENSNHFIRFVQSQDAAKWLECKEWINQEKVIREALTEARAMEAEARDYMQLQIGNLSILESRKSIQLANQQIKEAKRGMDCDLPNSRLCC